MNTQPHEATVIMLQPQDGVERTARLIALLAQGLARTLSAQPLKRGSPVDFDPHLERS